MAQDAHEAPVGRSRSSTSPATGMWESPPRRMETHAHIPSWSLPYAGTFVGGADPAFGAHISPAAADSRLPSEHVADHAWNQSVPSTGAHGGSGFRQNFLSLLEARSVTPETFEDAPVACDYLTGVGAAVASAMNMAGAAATYGLGSVDRYSAASVPSARHGTASSSLVYCGDSVVHGSKVTFAVPCYDHEAVKAGSQHQGFGAAFLQQTIRSRVVQSALGYSSMGSQGLADDFSFVVGSLPDAGSFGDYRSAAEFMSSNSNRHEQDTGPGMGNSSGGSGAASVATRRKSEERAGGGKSGNAKKSKQEASQKASPPKTAQAPKVKLGEKITALQQIVSPFGKTDTASVLFETIKYIKFLHEQLRQFSEPYMAKSGYKGHIQFGGEEKENTGTGHDLRGRGLCLVPVSLTSQVYHDDTLPDCWTPAYRSCLYR
ncbi:Transcription factor bHLH111 [Dichanthelium oligosanthes]|uniref:Transcription factor bHLH111 n=1 Tax=Dichanthelium oligosanthes TaxID=888268 RepID=A0A1E5W4Z9_9POAL|nr:Transcription factor bHLH111 [Dichanthelium oligosanthes]